MISGRTDWFIRNKNRTEIKSGHKRAVVRQRNQSAGAAALFMLKRTFKKKIYDRDT